MKKNKMFVSLAFATALLVAPNAVNAEETNENVTTSNAGSSFVEDVEKDSADRPEAPVSENAEVENTIAPDETTVEKPSTGEVTTTDPAPTTGEDTTVAPPTVTDTDKSNVKIVTRKEIIEPATKTINDKSKPEGVITEGKAGSKEVTYEVTYDGNKPVSAKRVSEKVLVAAVDKVVNVHAEEPADDKATTTVADKTNTTTSGQGGTGVSNTPAISPAKGDVKALPATGEVSIFAPAVVSLISGLGLAVPTVKKRK